MIDYLGTAWAALSIAEAAGVALALTYVLLAVRQNILCWAVAFTSSLIFLMVFYTASLYSLSALQIFYAAMAIYGWYQWRYAGADGKGVEVQTWAAARHVQVIAGIVAAALLGGWIMSGTDTAFPYTETLVTVASVAATFMMARKILATWAYWFAIDGVSIYLYMARDLHLTALLFLFYLILSVIGYIHWRRDFLAQGSRAR